MWVFIVKKKVMCQSVHVLPRLKDSQWLALNRRVTKEEVKDALMDMAPLKAPGPGGLHAMFFQNSWNVVGDSIFKVINDFFTCGILPERLNMTGNHGGQRKKKQNARFAIIAWWIWRWRNDFVFKGTRIDAKDKVAWLHYQFKEIETSLDKGLGPGDRQRLETRRGNPWRPLESG